MPQVRGGNIIMEYIANGNHTGKQNDKHTKHSFHHTPHLKEMYLSMLRTDLFYQKSPPVVKNYPLKKISRKMEKPAKKAQIMLFSKNHFQRHQQQYAAENFPKHRFGNRCGEIGAQYAARHKTDTDNRRRF